MWLLYKEKSKQIQKSEKISSLCSCSDDMKRKIIAKLNALQILIDSTWKINMNNMRTIYRITILSLFLYCVTVWYIFFEKFNYKMQQKQTLRIFKCVQRKATQIIEKIFKITSSVALDCETLFEINRHNFWTSSHQHHVQNDD